ncbi:putative N-acyl amino acid synthase, PEP-CTERM/exosortase system-associated [Azospirillaceae bacterium]
MEITPEFFQKTLLLPQRIREYLPGAMEQVRVGIAASSRDKQDVYSLRHAAYRNQNYIDEKPNSLFFDEYDELCNVFSLYVKFDEAVVASVRCCIHEPDQSSSNIPAFLVYPEARNAFSYERFIEANRLVTHPNLDHHSRTHALLLLRFVMAVAQSVDSVYILAAVRPRHAPFYQRYCNMTIMCNSRIYHGVKFPTVLMTTNFIQNYPLVLKKHSLFPLTDDERFFFRNAFHTINRKS